jgi:hypothetical protein
MDEDLVFMQEAGRAGVLEKRTVKELIKIARALKVRYSGLRKSEIIENIVTARRKKK